MGKAKSRPQPNPESEDRAQDCNIGKEAVKPKDQKTFAKDEWAKNHVETCTNLMSKYKHHLKGLITNILSFSMDYRM